jgi:hypothetical protein
MFAQASAYVQHSFPQLCILSCQQWQPNKCHQLDKAQAHVWIPVSPQLCSQQEVHKMNI